MMTGNGMQARIARPNCVRIRGEMRYWLASLVSECSRIEESRAQHSSPLHCPILQDRRREVTIAAWRELPRPLRRIGRSPLQSEQRDRRLAAERGF